MSSSSFAERVMGVSEGDLGDPTFLLGMRVLIPNESNLCHHIQSQQLWFFMSGSFHSSVPRS